MSRRKRECGSANGTLLTCEPTRRKLRGGEIDAIPGFLSIRSPLVG